MAQTFDEIAADIERTRDRLGANLQDLEDRFDTMIDWREHFRARPWVMLGTAGLFGFVLGAALRPYDERGDGMGRPSTPSVSQLTPLLDNLAEALLAVASARVKGVIADMIPGFQEQLARIESRANPE